MPARNCPFVAGYYYHIYNRGHNRKPIFLYYKDYMRYLMRLRAYALKHDVSIISYCLMPNHIHFIVRPNTDNSIEQFIHRLHTAYTMYFNKKYERVGSVFQGRFKAKLVETDEYFLHVSRYIHINPLEILRAQGPALRLEDYRWSSYCEYINPNFPTYERLCDINPIYSYFSNNQKVDPRIQYKQFTEDYIPRVDATLISNISNGCIEENTENTPLRIAM